MCARIYSACVVLCCPATCAWWLVAATSACCVAGWAQRTTYCSCIHYVRLCFTHNIVGGGAGCGLLAHVADAAVAESTRGWLPSSPQDLYPSIFICSMRDKETCDDLSVRIRYCTGYDVDVRGGFKCAKWPLDKQGHNSSSVLCVSGAYRLGAVAATEY